jgi:AcrR family transcriptional regulator
MGRKTIHNVDEKIMDEVIRETFKYGIAMISTKDVARRIHISEPVIFSHFKTKQNLIDQTFSYAWHKMPQEVIFPTSEADIRNPEVYDHYIARFNALLHFPKELVYEDAYYHSSYYHKDFAEKTMSGIIGNLIPVFAGFQTGRSEEQRRLMVTRYLENIISDLAQIARGVVPKTEENFRIAIGTILFGTYGLLTEYKALN